MRLWDFRSKSGNRRSIVGALKPEAYDAWIGWTPEQQWLHLVADSTRFAMLGEAGEHPNLASHALKLTDSRPGTDWELSFGCTDTGGLVVTLDALHSNSATAEMTDGRGADFVFTIKGSTPALIRCSGKLHTTVADAKRHYSPDRSQIF